MEVKKKLKNAPYVVKKSYYSLYKFSLLLFLTEECTKHET